MITGINLSETKKFISKYDKGDPQTVFKIGVLDSEQMVYVMSEEGQILKTMTNAVRFGLKDVEKFLDAKGNEILFETEKKLFGGRQHDVVADSIMKVIPTAVILEMGTEIMKMSDLSEQEAKN